VAGVLVVAPVGTVRGVTVIAAVLGMPAGKTVGPLGLLGVFGIAVLDARIW
jgi:hypothetical protein